MRDFNIDDFLMIEEALLSQQQKDKEKLSEAEYLNRQHRSRECKIRVNRAESLIEWARNETKRIRGEKFEIHRKSKKYQRGVLGNTVRAEAL